MPRSSGVVRCSNCGNESEWRLRYAVDDAGQGRMWAICMVCRCVLEFKMIPAEIRKLRKDGALKDD